MQKVNQAELNQVNGGYYNHCYWCCGDGKGRFEFYSTLSNYLHTKTSRHQKNWKAKRSKSRYRCCHGYGY